VVTTIPQLQGDKTEERGWQKKKREETSYFLKCCMVTTSLSYKTENTMEERV